jgi:uncharacterized protein YxjI
MMQDRFSYDNYLVRRKILKLFGGAFHIYGPQGQLVFYSQMKAFKLKEDIRIYTSEDMATEVLTIKARKIMDMSGVYDVVDPTTNENVGALKRKGIKSFIKDEWLFLNTRDQEIGHIQEDNIALALVRRFVIQWIPQSYQGEINGKEVCKFSQNFNPFVMKINLDFSLDKSGLLDRRLGIAAAILLCAIEGKQS